MRTDNASFNARYSIAGLTPALLYSNVANVPQYTVDATAIGGNNFSLDRGASQQAAIMYPARGMFTNQAISVLLRLKFAVAGTFGICEIASGSGWAMNQFLLYMVSDWRLTLTNQTPATVLSNGIVYGTAPANDTWIDAVITWTGTNVTNGIKLWIDGVNVGSRTALLAASNPRDSKRTSYINIGGVPGASNTRFLINECVIWDEVIDPSSVALTSGTGALNGASRTAFVDVPAYDGTAYSDPGIANVSSGTNYIYAGATLTGSLSLACDYPIAGNVRSGTSYASGSLTGTLVVPAASDVRTGVSVDATVGSLDVEQENITVEVEDYESITVTVEDQA